MGVQEESLANFTCVRELIFDWSEGRHEVCRLENDIDKYSVYHQIC